MQASQEAVRSAFGGLKIGLSYEIKAKDLSAKEGYTTSKCANGWPAWQGVEIWRFECSIYSFWGVTYDWLLLFSPYLRPLISGFELGWVSIDQIMNSGLILRNQNDDRKRWDE